MRQADGFRTCGPIGAGKRQELAGNPMGFLAASQRARTLLVANSLRHPRDNPAGPPERPP